MEWWKSLVKLVVRLVNRGVDKKEESEKIRKDNLQALMTDAKDVSASAKKSTAEAVKVNAEYQALLDAAKAMHVQAEALVKAGPPKAVPRRTATPKPTVITKVVPPAKSVVKVTTKPSKK